VFIFNPFTHKLDAISGNTIADITVEGVANENIQKGDVVTIIDGVVYKGIHPNINKIEFFDCKVADFFVYKTMPIYIVPVNSDRALLIYRKKIDSIGDKRGIIRNVYIRNNNIFISSNFYSFHNSPAENYHPTLLDTNKFIIHFRAYSESLYGKYVVVDYSTDNLNINTYTYNPGNTWKMHANYFKPGQAYIYFCDASNNQKPTLVKVDINGNVKPKVVIDDSVTLYDNSRFITLNKKLNDRYLLWLYDKNNLVMKFYIASVVSDNDEDDTITIINTYELGDLQVTFKPLYYDKNKILLFFRYDDKLYCKIATVDDSNQIQISDNILVSNKNLSLKQLLAVELLFDDTILLRVRENNASTGILFIRYDSVNNTFYDSDFIEFPKESNYTRSDFNFLKSDKFIACSVDDLSAKIILHTGKRIVNVDAIGIALQDANQNDSLQIKLSGNADVFNNLQTGKYYFVNKDGNLTTDASSYLLGIATSDTNLLIAKTFIKED